ASCLDAQPIGEALAPLDVRGKQAVAVEALQLDDLRTALCIDHHRGVRLGQERAYGDTVAVLVHAEIAEWVVMRRVHDRFGGPLPPRRAQERLTLHGTHALPCPQHSKTLGPAPHVVTAR